MEISNTNTDVELDTLLLQQFSCMATQDKDVLIAQFENLFGNSKPSRDVCAFYLEMNNWNLSAAVGSYFEFQQESNSFFSSPLVLPPACCPLASVVDPVDQTSQISVVPPNSKVHHTWKIKNTGNDVWPPGCTLRFIDGVQMNLFDRVSITRASPSEVVDVHLQLTSPQEVGSYESVWQLSTMTGMLFGSPLKLSIQVTTDCTLLMNLGYDGSVMTSETMSSEDYDAAATVSQREHTNTSQNTISTNFSSQEDSESMETS